MFVRIHFGSSFSPLFKVIPNLFLHTFLLKPTEFFLFIISNLEIKFKMASQKTNPPNAGDKRSKKIVLPTGMETRKKNFLLIRLFKLGVKARIRRHRYQMPVRWIRGFAVHRQRLQSTGEESSQGNALPFFIILS